MGSKVFTSGCLDNLEGACITGLRHVQAGSLAPVYVIVPGNLLALHLQRSLARASGSGHANVRFLTLIDYAEKLAGPSLTRAGRRPVAPLMEEILLGKTIDEVVPSDGYFSEIKGQVTFCRSVHSTLTDLREAAIEPQELESWSSRFVAPGGKGHKLKELAGIYTAYCNRLKQMGFFDRNDLLDESMALLNQDAIPDGPIFFYGFYDFNPLQRRLVECLIKKKEALFFFPWFDAAAFEYALPNLNWLKSLSCGHVPLDDNAPADGRRALQRITTVLFSPSGNAPNPNGAEDSIELLSAPGEAREAMEIARRCLRWVRDRGFKFSEIGILLRSQEPYATLLAESFSHVGIPFYLHGGSPLWSNRAGQSIGLIFKMLRDDLSRSSVMEFITFAPLAFDRIFAEKEQRASPSLWEFFSLQAGIVGGQHEWRERLGRLLPKVRRERESLEALIHFMEILLGLLEQIPQRASWNEFAHSLVFTAQELFTSSDSMQRVIDEAEKLGGYDLLEEETHRERFAQAVESALTSAREEVGSFGKEGVFIGDLMSARGLPFRGVIVPGMVERLFPLKHRQDPVLLDRERQSLSETLRKEVAQKERSYDEERLLFSLALMGAQERMLLTFPRLEPFTARERIPSFFLLRLMEATVGKAVDFSDFEKWHLLERVPLSRLFPRSASESLTPLEYDLSQADAALGERNLSGLDYLCRFSPFFSRSINAEARRWGERLFTEFDGVFRSRESRSSLEGLYGKEEISFSPTNLETYARCPYRYFLEVLLKLAELEEPDRLEALSALDRGALVHRILFLFYSRLKEEKRLPLRTQGQTTLEALLAELAYGVFKAFEEEKATGYPLLWALEKERIMESLQGFIKTEIDNREDFEPVYFEQSFTCRFPLDGKGAITLRGRIDRIDLSPDGRQARIIDYKTGQPQTIGDGEFKGGEALQLPLYLYAGSRELGGVEVVSAAYTYVTEKARYRRVLFTTDGWPGKFKTLQSIVRGLVKGIRNGIYPATPTSCRPCPYPLICGNAAEVLYERKRQDRRIRFFEDIKEIP